MDGQNVRTIVTGRTANFRWPNALTLDHVTGHIFWGDAGTDIIGMSDYMGNGYRKVLSLGKEHHIFSMSVFEDYLYWTNWETHSVERAHKYSGFNRTTVIPKFHYRPMGIKIVHPLLQRPIAKFSNPCHMGGRCSAVCTLSRNSYGYDCKCPTNFKKIGLLDCKHECKPWDFVCNKTFKCLPLWWRCDGQNDCGDWQDEMYRKPGACPVSHCNPNTYQCLTNGTTSDASATCLHPSKICDGARDCPLGDDEGVVGNVVDCSTYLCMDGMYKCKDSNKCISHAKRCDGKHDCPHRDDEMDCQKKNCSVFEFLCHSGNRCILSTYVCDQSTECEDGSDEIAEYCKMRRCGRGEFRCNTGRCIPENWECDGEPDCPRGDDEKMCNATRSCDRETQFTCLADLKCISKRFQCDGHSDCVDGSDEEDCHQRLRCRDSEFLCEDRRKCVEKSLVCNGIPDCDDRSDEAPKHTNCSSQASQCMKKQFKCRSSNQCIKEEWKCDGEVDCFDGSDEEACSGNCSSGMYACANGRCIPQLWVCDGVEDCGDGSDEAAGKCKRRACPPSLRKCGSGHCYPSQLHCDGVAHCRDGSDENNKETCDNGVSRDSCEFQCGNGHCVSKKIHLRRVQRLHGRI